MGELGMTGPGEKALSAPKEPLSPSFGGKEVPKKKKRSKNRGGGERYPEEKKIGVLTRKNSTQHYQGTTVGSAIHKATAI